MFEHSLFYDWVQVLKKLLWKYNESYLHYILLLPNIWKCYIDMSESILPIQQGKKLNLWSWSNRLALLKKTYSNQQLAMVVF